jgi:hypothetical protein
MFFSMQPTASYAARHIRPVSTRGAEITVQRLESQSAPESSAHGGSSEQLALKLHTRIINHRIMRASSGIFSRIPASSAAVSRHPMQAETMSTP